MATVSSGLYTAVIHCTVPLSASTAERNFSSESLARDPIAETTVGWNSFRNDFTRPDS